MLNGGAIMSCALILNKIDPRSSLADKYDFLFNNLHKLGGEIECAGVLGSCFISKVTNFSGLTILCFSRRGQRPTETSLWATL